MSNYGNVRFNNVASSCILVPYILYLRALSRIVENVWPQLKILSSGRLHQQFSKPPARPLALSPKILADVDDGALRYILDDVIPPPPPCIYTYIHIHMYTYMYLASEAFAGRAVTVALEKHLVSLVC